jgi:cell wall-associated NlpC family hydrolase
MTTGSLTRHMRQAGILAVAVAMLLSAVPAFGETVTATPTPAPAPSNNFNKYWSAPARRTPATPKQKTQPKPADRTPADTNSAIQTPLTQQTEAFRQALAEKQRRVDEFNAQLDALDRELEIASQEYNNASDRLTEMKNKVQVAQADLENARQAYDLQSSILSQRAASNYKDGNLGMFEVLLDSKSMSDLVARMKFLNTIGLADASMAASLKGQKELLETQVADLQSSKIQAESLEFEMKARRIEVTLRIGERQKMMADAQKDLLALLDNEAGRRSTDQTALLTDVLSGASKAGIVVEPGSPVETALAYHGVPYLWAGAAPSGFDCSGLILYVYKQHGVTLPHYSGSQFLLGEKVAAADLAPGDVVFFGSPIHHVGMYIGGGYFLHAPRTGDFVKISKLSDRNDFAGARRYPWEYRVNPPLNAVTTPAKALGKVN